MKNLFLLVLVMAPFTGHTSVNLTGAWTTVSAQCKLSGQVPVKVKPLLESLSMVFTDTTVSQTMTLMPNCMVTSEGTYQIVADQIQFGKLKSKLSTGCPSGISVKDKEPAQNRFRIEANDLVIEALAGMFCAQSNDTLELRLKKNSRWSPLFRY
tara:strand:- start:9822 stop:10283 length:462 start_codon:yes stop_codon:yes gene_type:complete